MTCSKGTHAIWKQALWSSSWTCLLMFVPLQFNILHLSFLYFTVKKKYCTLYKMDTTWKPFTLYITIMISLIQYVVVILQIWHVFDPPDDKRKVQKCSQVEYSIINLYNYCVTSCFIISLLYASTCFDHCVLIIRRSKLYYIAFGIITPVGGRPVHKFSLNQCMGQPPTGVMIPDAV